jgi:hypothetical protein
VTTYFEERWSGVFAAWASATTDRLEGRERSGHGWLLEPEAEPDLWARRLAIRTLTEGEGCL